jgi:hypothetical protein
MRRTVLLLSDGLLLIAIAWFFALAATVVSLPIVGLVKLIGFVAAVVQS